MSAGTDAATSGAAAADGVDWDRWHAAYDDPGSALALRLALVQGQLRAALTRAPAGPVRAISVCAGQGHDLIGALADHPRRADVSARLVELDPGNLEQARRAAAAAGLRGLELVCADAGLTDSYAGAVPAGIVLLCGVFGNISEADVLRTIGMLPTLCAPGATAIWTRHRNPPDLVPEILAGFERAGFDTVALQEGRHLAVGSSRLTGPPAPFRPGETLFHFLGKDALWPHLDERTRDALGALFRPDCSLHELVEAMRALPPGGPPRQGDEEMLREARGTSAAKHRFLAELLAARFPQTAPVVVHRVYRLTPALAGSLYGEEVARSVPAPGIVDVHRYLTLELAAGRVPLDVTTGGAPWDGRSPLDVAVGEGTDQPAGPDPDADLRALEEAVCDDAARAPFLAALAGAGLPRA